MADEIIFRQDDWSNGIGDIYDPHGLAWATGWTGGRGYLSPNAAAIYTAATRFTSGYILRHGFVNDDDDGGDPHLYLILDNGTDHEIEKVDLSTATFGADQLSSSFAGNTLVGHPIKYKGNWYYTELGGSVMRKLTATKPGNIADDTLTDGDAGSGDGHLINYGHQLGKIQLTAGIEILSTGGDANLDADWSSPFPVGDSSDTAIGGASVRGLAYVLRGRGLFTFNDRGRSGSVFEDFGAWQQADIKYWTIEPWKGGVVFTRFGSIFYWNPGSGDLPQDISIGASDPIDDKRLLTNLGNIQYTSLSVIGNYLYVGYDIGSKSGILFGKPSHSEEKIVSWYNFLNFTSTIPSGARAIPITEAQTPAGTNATTFIALQTAERALSIIPLNIDGSPMQGTAEAVQTAGIATLPYIELNGKTPTRVRISVEGITQNAANPAVLPAIEVYGNQSLTATTRPLIGTIRTNGISEFTLRNSATISDYLSLELKQVSESNQPQVLPPTVRWIEVYAEE